MNFVNEETLTLNRVSITNLLQEIGPEEVRAEIVAGLQAEQKFISSKYFYNREGSILFEEITSLKEYYPTRTEKGILKQIAPDLIKRYGNFEIIELGPGDHSKISILLRAAAEQELTAIHYIPLDISQPALKNSAEELVSTFSKLHVEGYAVDFFSQPESIKRERPALICFFGSTIGNFEWDDSVELLCKISEQMKKGDVLLLGTDMIKPEPILHVAYNDARGVTEAFNKNILNNVNDLIGADFNADDFAHHAYFDREKARIEMHLVARKDVSVHSKYFDDKLVFSQGDTIHTENSHKYNEGHIQKMAEASGLRLNHTRCDEQGWFALTEFQKM